MNSVRSSLEMIVKVVKDAAHPLEVGVRTGGAVQDDAEVSVIPVSVERVGRSRRDGPILDLQLTVAVLCTGPTNIDIVEDLFAAVEMHSSYSIGPLDWPVAPPGAAGLGFRVSVPVPVRLTEPHGPPVKEPLTVQTVVGGR